LRSYDERLAVPWWAWPAALALSVLLAAQVHGGGTGFTRAVLPYIVLPLLTLAGLLALSRGRVQVRDGVLHVPGARVPLAAVGAVTALDAEATRRLRGPVAHPLAYVATRPWLPLAVRVDLDDPDDDTPYWLVGTRHPAELAAALREAGRTSNA
jgi:hypothetical protein